MRSNPGAPIDPEASTLAARPALTLSKLEFLTRVGQIRSIDQEQEARLLTLASSCPCVDSLARRCQADSATYRRPPRSS